jgi:hypothetical protein
LGYLDGVTSAVQTQLDAKIAKFDGTTYDVNALAAVTQAEYDALTPSATTFILYYMKLGTNDIRQRLFRHG